MWGRHNLTRCNYIMIYINLYTYCWWLKSCTTCDTKNLVNVINYQPQLVSLPSSTMGEFHVSKFPRWMINCHLEQGHLDSNPQRVTNRIVRYGWFRDGFCCFKFQTFLPFLVPWMIFFECSTWWSLVHLLNVLKRSPNISPKEWGRNLTRHS